MLALSVREAMEQAIASLQAGHVTAGMDISMHGQRSTDGIRPMDTVHMSMSKGNKNPT